MLLREPLGGLRRGERLAWYDDLVIRTEHERPSRPPTRPTRRPPSVEPDEPGSRGGVAAALLEFGRSGRISEAFGAAAFTPKLEANQLIIADPFAFASLHGVVFDQGIPAEKRGRRRTSCTIDSDT